MSGCASLSTPRGRSSCGPRARRPGRPARPYRTGRSTFAHSSAFRALIPPHVVGAPGVPGFRRVRGPGPSRGLDEGVAQWEEAADGEPVPLAGARLPPSGPIPLDRLTRLDIAGVEAMGRTGDFYVEAASLVAYRRGARRIPFPDLLRASARRQDSGRRFEVYIPAPHPYYRGIGGGMEKSIWRAWRNESKDGRSWSNFTLIELMVVVIIIAGAGRDGPAAPLARFRGGQEQNRAGRHRRTSRCPPCNCTAFTTTAIPTRRRA